MQCDSVRTIVIIIAWLASVHINSVHATTWKTSAYALESIMNALFGCEKLTGSCLCSPPPLVLLLFQIAVLDEGRIVEKGNHRELMEHGGIYAEMWREQMKERPASVAAT